MKIFVTPREIVWGRGSISHLEKIPGKRALIVTDETMTKLGTVARAEDYLKKGGLDAKVFNEVEPEPSINTILKIVEQHRGFNPDVIVGLGGGSAIDASKAFRLFLENPDLTFEEVRFFGGPPKTPIPPFKKTISVGIPSTSGTGSEVSWSSIITDPSIPAKCVIHSTELIPSLAIVDPDIADSMPKSLQADTGLDALTHAIESYVSLQANDFSRGCALHATTLLMKYLPPAYLQDDKEAKEHVHYAPSIAGMSVANSGLGVDHIVSAMVGNMFHLTHGQSCGIVLPYVIKFNAGAAEERFTELARAIGYTGGDISEAVDYLVQRVIELKKQLGHPESYREAGIPEEAYLAAMKGFIEKSAGHPSVISNPRKCTAEDFVELYNACYYGNYDVS